MAKITMQRLKAAAEDLNTLYEKPAIKINAETTDKALIAAIEKCGEGLEDGDLLTQATVDLLIELEIDVPSKIKIKKEAKVIKPAKADKPEKKAKTPKEKGTYISREGTQAAYIDSLLKTKLTFTELTNKFAKQYKQDPKKAAFRIKIHLAFLEKKGIKTNVKEG